MDRYTIITDSGSDLPVEMLEQLGVRIASLTLSFRGEDRPDAVTDQIREVYDALRAGETAVTSAVNPQGWADVIRPVLEAGEDALVLCFSSGLSATFRFAEVAAQELAAEFPQRKIRVVDTRCASLGQGLLVWLACDQRDRGMELEELAAWVEQTREHLCQWFTVDDLMYLKRGGRISATTALVGTMLKIKPVLHVDDQGHLINISKVRGRKAAIEALADKVAQLGTGDFRERVAICHGDCVEDAHYLSGLLKERHGVKEVFIGYTGAVIGSHSGPGTLAVFFLGTHR